MDGCHQGTKGGTDDTLQIQTKRLLLSRWKNSLPPPSPSTCHAFGSSFDGGFSVAGDGLSLPFAPSKRGGEDCHPSPPPSFCTITPRVPPLLSMLCRRSRATPDRASERSLQGQGEANIAVSARGREGGAARKRDVGCSRGAQARGWLVSRATWMRVDALITATTDHKQGRTGGSCLWKCRLQSWECYHPAVLVPMDR